MKNQNYDLAIVFRVYPKISKNTPVFKNDKYKLVKLCLKSFKLSLGSLRSKIWVLLDDCPSKYEDLFNKYFNSEDLEIIKLDGIGNYATFGLQIKILLEQNFSNIVYLAEDDYYYLPNQFEKIILFLKNHEEAHFITPYDHLDYYLLEFHSNPTIGKKFLDKYWRCVDTACCTFLTTKEILFKTRKVLNLYSKKLTDDAAMWVCLTKHKIFHIFRILKFYFHDRKVFKIYLVAWLRGWKYILFGKKWKLWAPIPTIGTHMSEKYLPPRIDWESIFQKEIKNLNEE